MYITKPYFRGIRGCVSTGYGISHIVGEHACMYACMGFYASKDSYGDITLAMNWLELMPI